MFRTSWLLGAACALLFVLGAGQAVASTVTVSPTGAKTLTSTTGMQLSVGGRNVNMTTCTITATWSNASGTLPLFFSPPTAAASPVDNTRGNMTFACTGCRLVGGAGCTFTCDRQMNAAATNVTSSGLTLLRLTGIHCTVAITGGSCSAVLAGVTAPNDGGADGSYNNSSSLLTVFVTGQNLAVVSSTCPALLPTGTAILASPTAGPVVFLTSPATRVTAV
jgi:hypothetical protein